ncbi:MAG: hypothetical protein KF721_14080 [Ignavibacteriaceae bacterium]|nr:hypothetical protein [Ignavibacteriaceae bacterium]
MRLLKLFLLLISLHFFIGCADKLDTGTLINSSGEGNIAGDTLYVQLNPVWEGFNKPQDIYIGNEPFIYIADTDNNSVKMYNLAGQLLGQREIKKPIAIGQDYQLNLLVCAEFDTVVGGQNRSYSAVYKLDMVSAGHIIENAPITRILPQATDFTKPNRKYSGVAGFYDNSFYVTRRGPDNSSIIDPDNSILIFEKKLRSNGTKIDTLIGRIPLIDPIGSGIESANQVSAITPFKKRNIDFIITMIGDNSFKVQWLQYLVTTEFSGYKNKLSPFNAGMMIPNKFSKPEGVTVDNSGNIYVADSGKDSIYVFNSSGDEMKSFGGPTIFNAPHGVAFFDKVLYVADTGNNRILRYILSTDLR